MIVELKAITRKPKITKYGDKISVGILTAELGETNWINGWEDEINKTWKKGDKVDIKIEENGIYKNFTALKQPGFLAPNNTVKAKIDDDKWDKISWGKCKYGFLIEAFKIKYRDLIDTEYDDLEGLTEEYADMAMRNTRELKKAKKEELSTIDIEECSQEVNIDEIPF